MFALFSISPRCSLILMKFDEICSDFLRFCRKCRKTLQLLESSRFQLNFPHSEEFQDSSRNPVIKVQQTSRGAQQSNSNMENVSNARSSAQMTAKRDRYKLYKAKARLLPLRSTFQYDPLYNAEIQHLDAANVFEILGEGGHGCLDPQSGENRGILRLCLRFRCFYFSHVRTLVQPHEQQQQLFNTCRSFFDTQSFWREAGCFLEARISNLMKSERKW